MQRIVLDSAATDGRLAVVRQTMRGGAASPVHVHAHEDETIFLLSGTGTFWAGDQRWDLSSGDTVFLPRGVPHTYVLTSDAAAAELVGQRVLGPPLAVGDDMPEAYL